MPMSGPTKVVNRAVSVVDPVLKAQIALATTQDRDLRWHMRVGAGAERILWTRSWGSPVAADRGRRCAGSVQLRRVALSTRLQGASSQSMSDGPFDASASVSAGTVRLGVTRDILCRRTPLRSVRDVCASGQHGGRWVVPPRQGGRPRSLPRRREPRRWRG